MLRGEGSEARLKRVPADPSLSAPRSGAIEAVSLTPLTHNNAMSLADELLNDFASDEEGDGSGDKNILGTVAEEDEENAEAMDLDGIDADEAKMEDDLSNIIVQQIDDVKKLARLISSDKMDGVLRRIEQYTATHLDGSMRQGNLEDDPEYKLVVEANAVSADLDQEIQLVNKFIKDRYKPKFPELESLIRNPLDYANTVRIIGNEMNIVKLDFSTVVSSAEAMVVKTAATTTKGQPLSEVDLAIITKACDMAIDLDQAKRKVQDFVQSRISLFAPNVTALIGSQTAAKIVGVAGGLKQLTAKTADTLPSIGSKRTHGTGFAVSYVEGSQGFLYHSDFIQRIPHDERRVAQRRMSAKIILCARVDLNRSSPDGSYGQKIRKELDENLRKHMTPPQLRAARALRAPLDAPSKKRGGKRVRKAKERNATTELQKLQNRMKFGEAEEEVGYGDETEGLGMLTQTGSVKALIADNRTKAKLGKAMQARLNSLSGIKTSLSKDSSSGLQSSLAFTPVQGIELINPSLNNAAKEEMAKKANDKWFLSGTFSQIQKPKGQMLPPMVPKK
jgi:U4/U6 small nuclear ribonucleoprotein PRP31